METYARSLSAAMSPSFTFTSNLGSLARRSGAVDSDSMEEFFAGGFPLIITPPETPTSWGSGEEEREEEGGEEGRRRTKVTFFLGDPEDGGEEIRLPSRPPAAEQQEFRKTHRRQPSLSLPIAIPFPHRPAEEATICEEGGEEEEAVFGKMFDEPPSAHLAEPLPMRPLYPGFPRTPPPSPDIFVTVMPSFPIPPPRPPVRRERYLIPRRRPADSLRIRYRRPDAYNSPYVVYRPDGTVYEEERSNKCYDCCCGTAKCTIL